MFSVVLNELMPSDRLIPKDLIPKGRPLVPLSDLMYANDVQRKFDNLLVNGFEQAASTEVWNATCAIKVACYDEYLAALSLAWSANAFAPSRDARRPPRMPPNMLTRAGRIGPVPEHVTVHEFGLVLPYNLGPHKLALDVSARIAVDRGAQWISVDSTLVDGYSQAVSRALTRIALQRGTMSDGTFWHPLFDFSKRWKQERGWVACQGSFPFQIGDYARLSKWAEDKGYV